MKRIDHMVWVTATPSGVAVHLAEYVHEDDHTLRVRCSGRMILRRSARPVRTNGLSLACPHCNAELDRWLHFLELCAVYDQETHHCYDDNECPVQICETSPGRDLPPPQVEGEDDAGDREQPRSKRKVGRPKPEHQ